MKIRFVFILIALISFGVCGVQGQQANVKNSLTETQKQGQRLFQQRCSVCHTPATVVSRSYGPYLTKELITAAGDTARQIIMNGTDHMPGFRYGLEPSEINAIIEYLKTGAEAGQAGNPNEKSNSPM
jgi:mono/diheme cytochrome c family protein